jgi:hypothetical protein
MGNNCLMPETIKYKGKTYTISNESINDVDDESLSIILTPKEPDLMDNPVYSALVGMNIPKDDILKVGENQFRVLNSWEIYTNQLPRDYTYVISSNTTHTSIRCD